MATTGICNSWKVEAMFAAHCFGAIVAISGTTTNTAFTITGLASTAGIAVGMAATGTGVAAGAVVASVDSQSQVTLSKASTASATVTVTFTGDAFKILLIRVTPGRTFDNTQTNVGTPGTGSPTTSNVGTDEVTAGGGYTSGGVALVNTSPSLPGSPSTTATVSFANPSWTSATISTTAAIIYNTNGRLGAAATASITGRSVSVHDFGGTQTVTAGTLTLVMPTNDGTNAIIRIA
jgi:hypothetical protein